MSLHHDPCPDQPCRHCASGQPVNWKGTNFEWCQFHKSCAASIDWEALAADREAGYCIHEKARREAQGITSLWACKACGADNRPKHCQDEWCERTRVCRCTCEGCEPPRCRECGVELETAQREEPMPSAPPWLVLPDDLLPQEDGQARP